MSGAGNDFIVIDNRSVMIVDGAALARKICDRHWGVGADGLLLLESSDKVSYRMMYYNADGSYGGMCGNGGRCIAMFAFRKKIASKDHKFEALGHIYTTSIMAEDVSLNMQDPVSISKIRYLSIGKKKIAYQFINTGSPHIVINITELIKNGDLDGLDVMHWGKLLRWHKKFSPAGTNPVNFMKKLESGAIQLRTFERGVEAETFACGTGSIATAIIASKKWKLMPPITIIPTSKIPLIVEFDLNGSGIQNVKLSGPAVVTFAGNLDV
jgi:diaminopimelate epimerase